MSDHHSLESCKDEIILVLGMINSNTEYENLEIYGQEWRDFQRILSLTKLGFKVYSLDDKHEPIVGRHCKANFNDPRRMGKSLNSDESFAVRLHAKFILLDYFFCPVIIFMYFSKSNFNNY